MCEFIQSKENSKVKEAYKAKEGKGDRFLVEGFHLVEMALEHQMADAIFSLKDYRASAPVYLVTPEIIAKLSSTVTPEGIVALCHKIPAKAPSHSRLLYLDEVRDPGNVGTLLRTALAFGFSDVILSKGSAEAYSSKVLLASQGAIFALNFSESKQAPEQDIIELKTRGYRIIATDLKAAVPPEEIETLDQKICLVLGNEAHGVAPSILSQAHQTVRIPMGGIDSLNVAIAGGILLYLLSRK
ncbi:MAG: RNA methyltransferase [Bacilli bacterium]